MNDEQRKAMFAGQGNKKGHGISSGIRAKNDSQVIRAKGMNGKREPWKKLSEQESKELIPRIWNETLTLEQRRSAIDEIIGDRGFGNKVDHWYDTIHKGERNNFNNLPKDLQNQLLDHYRFRTTLEYDGSNDHGWSKLTPDERKEIVRKGANGRRQFSNIAVWHDSFTGNWDEKSPLLKSAFEKGLGKQ